MSTPNTSKVKWVPDHHLENAREDCGEYPGEVEAIPVIPLADLTELVEFVQEILENAVICTHYENGEYKCIHCGATNEPSGEFAHLDDCETHTARQIKAQLEAHRKDGADGQ